MAALRCPDCNKFNAGMPEINGTDIELDGDEVVAKIELVVNCTECGSELATMPDEFEFRTDIEIKHGTHVCACGHEHECEGIIGESDINNEYEVQLDEATCEEDWVVEKKIKYAEVSVTMIKVCPFCHEQGQETMVEKITTSKFIPSNE